MRERSWRPVVVVGATYLVGQDGICHRYRAVLLDNFHVMHLELFLKSSYRVVKRGNISAKSKRSNLRVPRAYADVESKSWR